MCSLGEVHRRASPEEGANVHNSCGWWQRISYAGLAGIVGVDGGGAKGSANAAVAKREVRARYNIVELVDNQDNQWIRKCCGNRARLIVAGNDRDGRCGARRHFPGHTLAQGAAGDLERDGPHFRSCVVGGLRPAVGVADNGVRRERAALAAIAEADAHPRNGVEVGIQGSHYEWRRVGGLYRGGLKAAAHHLDSGRCASSDR